jgi:hypothetical protein
MEGTNEKGLECETVKGFSRKGVLTNALIFLLSCQYMMLLMVLII